MLPSQTSSSRRPKTKSSPGAERLESRSLLTGGAGNTFALVPAVIDEPGGTVDVAFTISQPPFRLPRGKMVVGVDAVAQPGSGVTPLVSQIANPHGDVVPQAIHSIYDPHLSRGAVAAGAGTSAVLTPIVLFPNQANRSATYTATISGENNTSGDVIVGFYLPGDADGDGVVNNADLTIVRGSMNSVVGDGRYNFDADANRDGRVGLIDLAYTLQNQGVSTTVTPFVTANLDPASDTGAQDRITDLTSVRIQGSGTPGSTLLIEDLSGRNTPIESVIGADGNYIVTLPLSSGANRYQVTSTDSFGQQIVGQIDPIIFSPFAQGPTTVSTKASDA